MSAGCLLVVLLLAVVFAPRAEEARPAIGDWGIVVGAGVGVLVYVSALLHELGHAVLARRYGHQVPAIGLSMAGGRTAVVGAARTPREELLTSAAGPAVSVGVGLVALVAALASDDALLVEVLEALVLANLLLGLLDLLPAPPLDGGRVARAVGWWVGGTKATGVRTAVWSGRAVAVTVLAYPWLAFVTWSPIPFPFLVLVCAGVFVILWLSRRCRGRYRAAVTEDPTPDVPVEAWSGVHRGPLRQGEWVRLIDAKGRRHNFELEAGQRFFSSRGHVEHDEIIGREEGFTVGSSGGAEYLVFRPLLSEYVVSMPRGAAVVYPKDAAQIVALADIFPGADVVEAGAGSGSLTCSLLRAVGPSGRLRSYERREEFADVARRNVTQHFGGDHPAWTLTLGDLVEALPASDFATTA